MNREEIQDRANKIKWFHNYELVPGVFTSGYSPVKEEDRGALFQIPMDLRGKRVLDVGCADGYFTFLAEARGASVVATDAWPHQGFFLAHEVRGSKAEFHQIDIYDLQPDTFGLFDIVFFTGVYYHLKNPILALERIARVTREAAIIESQVTDLGLSENEGGSRFYEHDELAPGDPTNWWAPNIPCLLQTVRAAGFPRVELITCYNNNTRAVVHAFKGPRTAAKMLTEDFVCLIHTPVANAELNGTVSVSGVAFSKLEPEGGIERLTVYLDNLDDPAFEVGVAERGRWHAEVATRVGDKYGPVGFEFNWDTTDVTPGPHTLYVLAEGKRGWHYSRQPVVVKGSSRKKLFQISHPEIAEKNRPASKTNTGQWESVALSGQSQLAEIERLGQGVGVSLSTQPDWPLANNMRRAFHNLVIYYVNMLANKQKDFNQAISAMLKQIVASQERIVPEVEALRKEVKALQAEAEALQAELEKQI